ncbi:hypothetical protein [Paenibacillus xanthanilyticus]|uniref:Uncharacterized protein n=1 Tax=Paenibacillus xanthanilyticus TaxID=1783531 RepID=A0ABV8K1I6_9BACL
MAGSGNVPLRLNAVWHGNRHAGIEEAKLHIREAGGWIIDFKPLSNRSICLLFEIEPQDVRRLLHILPTINIQYEAETIETLTLLSDKPKSERRDADLKGTLQLTFMHDEPDLIMDVPAFDL